MEPLWSPGVATGGNQRQIGWLSEPQKQANSVATGCRPLREVTSLRRRGSTLLQRALSLAAAVRAWAPIATAAGARLADPAESVSLLAALVADRSPMGRIGKVMRST